jgi:hypothetical protein
MKYSLGELVYSEEAGIGVIINALESYDPIYKIKWSNEYHESGLPFTDEMLESEVIESRILLFRNYDADSRT